MSDGALHLLALISAIAGMGTFACANEVHWKQLFGARPQSSALRLRLKRGGSGFLVLSLLLCVLADPLSMALLVWPMLLGVAAALVATFLTVKNARTAEGKGGHS